jgi:hypothetical protein
MLSLSRPVCGLGGLQAEMTSLVVLKYGLGKYGDEWFICSWEKPTDLRTSIGTPRKADAGLVLLKALR